MKNTRQYTYHCDRYDELRRDSEQWDSVSSIEFVTGSIGRKAAASSAAIFD
jgi:hypothetical protein